MTKKRASSTENTGAAVDNDFYHSVFDSMEDYAVFTTDEAGLVTSWNKGAERVLGYSEKEMLQKNCAILFTKTDIETQEPEKELKNALKKGSALDERFHVKKDGTRFWASGKVFPVFNRKKEHIGFTKVMRNLTDRMQAEERITRARRFAESIIAWAAEPIVVLNEDLTVNTANAAFMDSYGVTRKKNFNIPFGKFAHGFFDRPEFKVITDELKNGRGNVFNHELSYVLPDNDKRILLINGRRVSPDTDSTIYMLSVQDITERRMLEQQRTTLSALPVTKYGHR